LKNPKAATKLEDAAKRQLLTPAEEKTLIAHIHELATRTLPPNRTYIKRAALNIAQARDPSITKIGKNWVERFLAQHQDELVTAWTKSLDTSRAAAVNPNTIQHYWDLFSVVKTEHNFKDENTYGFDETGCLFCGDETKECVYTARGGSVQHKQAE
jgi:hypothetical protein